MLLHGTRATERVELASYLGSSPCQEEHGYKAKQRGPGEKLSTHAKYNYLCGYGQLINSAGLTCMFTRVKEFVYTNHESILPNRSLIESIQTMPGKQKIKKQHEHAAHKGKAHENKMGPLKSLGEVSLFPFLSGGLHGTCK